MFLSIFEIFKIGVGPSSSHTMGPMIATKKFLEKLRTVYDQLPSEQKENVHLQCSLHGSLAFTGKGHGTDKAVILGFAGCVPETIDPDEAIIIEQKIHEQNFVQPFGFSAMKFMPKEDIIFDYDTILPEHPNGMQIMAHLPNNRNFLVETYFSVGGGFVLTRDEITCATDKKPVSDSSTSNTPYSFSTAQSMLDLGEKHAISIANMKRANEIRFRSQEELNSEIDKIWETMNACINRGLKTSGILPGGLNVKRRSSIIYQQLLDDQGSNDNKPHTINDWISVYAMAVNEENAAGGKVVTSPTNGAAGVVPAVIRYYLDFVSHAKSADVRDFLLVAAAIGGIIKHNASIAGAEVGCQGEVGSASAMAAAGLCAVLGGTNSQIENAAEIALEHHLGMTCDPVAGLVQVPCIERNALGAVKAITAASLSLRGDGEHFVPLDTCIATMRQTGLDMHEKYKETSTGGLAAHISVNLPSC
jgi:L-serine dehydratase